MPEIYPADLPPAAYPITIRHNQAKVTRSGSGISFVRKQVARVKQVGFGIKNEDEIKVMESWLWFIDHQGDQVILPPIPQVINENDSAKILEVSRLNQASSSQASFSVVIEIYG